jgi:hypothetical protein
LPLPKREGSLGNKVLLDGREATLYQELYGFRILIGPLGDMGGNEYIQYRYEDLEEWKENQYGGKIVTKSGLNVMLTLFDEWDGYGYPPGWYRRMSGNRAYMYNPDNLKEVT